MPPSITRQDALDYHRNGRPGKLEVTPTKPVNSQRDLSLAYSPGVADAVREIDDDPLSIYELTAKANLVAVVSNGTAILGLGDLGPEASVFVDAADSPNGNPLLIVCNEVSGSTTIYEVRDTYTLQLLHASDLEGGVAQMQRRGSFPVSHQIERHQQRGPGEKEQVEAGLRRTGVGAGPPRLRAHHDVEVRVRAHDDADEGVIGRCVGHGRDYTGCGGKSRKSEKQESRKTGN